MSRNLNALSESGMTRRQWKDFCKLHNTASNLVIACQNDFYHIALRAARRGQNWRELYELGRTKNLNAEGLSMMPRIP